MSFDGAENDPPPTTRTREPHRPLTPEQEERDAAEQQAIADAVDGVVP